MALNLVSPGVKVREVDLTIGRIDTINDQVGAIAGPFERGPINTPVRVENEQELLEFFGKPKVADAQNEYWMSASSYLSYGGTLRVIRTGSTDPSVLINANSGVSADFVSSLKINNKESYDSLGSVSDWYYAARNPGSWASNLKVCTIDNFADQIITGVSTAATNQEVFSAVTTKSSVTVGVTTTLIGINTSLLQEGQFIDEIFGVIGAGTTITSVGSGEITVSPATLNLGETTIDLSFGTISSTPTGDAVTVGCAVTQFLNKTGPDGVTYDGYLRGVVTGVGNDEVYVRITDRVDSNGVSFPTNYANPGSSNNINAFSFDTLRGEPVYFLDNVGVAITSITEDFTISDWYNEQTLGLDNQVIYWKNVAEKPGTSQYAAERNGKYDEINVVVVDDDGSVTGVAANIVEKFVKLSKAADGRISPSALTYYIDYIADNSNYIFAGAFESGTSGNIVVSSNVEEFTYTSGTWGSNAQGVTFDVSGKNTYTLLGGKDYSGTNNVGGYETTLGDVLTSYEVLRNPAEYSVNYLLSGPSFGSIYETQQKANTLINIAEERKDCIAVISPFKSSVVEGASATEKTNGILAFFNTLSSSSYAVFDSGYKYTYDRFNNTFLYLPCSSDVAGLMARTSTNNYPWFSPAGSARGTLNNVIKLAYNPSQAQRDDLYANRINPIIANQGNGFILYGDKTALSYPSAFDRINVRRLFLTLEATIEKAARAQLFEFNDIITRNNFVNIVEPYLRDVKAKRGITEFVVVCDETNNTPDVIDSNQFKADIFVKPARSINYIGLTFVATRTGVSFSEVVGTV